MNLTHYVHSMDFTCILFMYIQMYYLILLHTDMHAIIFTYFAIGYYDFTVIGLSLDIELSSITPLSIYMLHPTFEITLITGLQTTLHIVLICMYTACQEHDNKSSSCFVSGGKMALLIDSDHIQYWPYGCYQIDSVGS